MNSNFPSEETIRQYLLGKFDGQNDLENRLSEQLFLNTELSETVDMIEDEIIEDYLDGMVSAADKITIEEYFLRPPERKEKLQLARLLRDHFEIKAGGGAKKKLNADGETAGLAGQSGAPRILQWRSHWRTYGEIAAAILLIALSAVYVSRVNHDWQSQLEATRKNQAQLEGELAQERERSATLAKQLDELPPPVVALTFLGPTFRDQADMPVVKIGPWTQRMIVEIGLPGTDSGEYRVRLETKTGKAVRPELRATASSGALRFEMPIEGISTGAYCLVVTSRPEPYCFQARVSKN